MIPLAIMAAMSIAQNRAKAENNEINNLNQNRVAYNQQQQQMIPMRSAQNSGSGLGNAMSSLSQIYSMFGK